MSKLIFLLVFAMFISGCAPIRGFPEPAPASSSSFPESGYLLGENGIERYNQETDLSKKRIIRNEIVDARMEELDRQFADFERELYKEGVGSGIGTDWTLLAFTAATTVTGGASTKAALGAISTAIVGGKAAFDKRALFDTALPTLIAQMVAQRESVRVGIRLSEELSVESYSVFAALSDLHRFEFAGSIPGALQAIAEDAGAKIEQAKRDVQDIRKAAYAKTRAGNLLRSFWKPDGKNIDEPHEARLKAWMAGNGIATGAGSITMFLRSDVMEDARLKAVKDLGISN